MRIKAHTFLLGLLVVLLLEALHTKAQPANIAGIDEYIQNFREKNQIADLIEKKLQDSTLWERQNLHEDLYVAIEWQSKNSAKVTEWYFAGAYLLYTETSWWNLNAMQTIDNEKTYHQQGKLIAWLLPGHGFANSNSAEYKQRDRELREVQKQLRMDASE